jgi:hypothetical protein
LGHYFGDKKIYDIFSRLLLLNVFLEAPTAGILWFVPAIFWTTIFYFCLTK